MQESGPSSITMRQVPRTAGPDEPLAEDETATAGPSDGSL